MKSIRCAVSASVLAEVDVQTIKLYTLSKQTAVDRNAALFTSLQAKGSRSTRIVAGLTNLWHANDIFNL